MSDLPPEQVPDGVPITINGKELVAEKGELIIDAAERHGVYIPRFCYHPRMRPVGMCRMCICEVDTGRGPALLPTCMLECTPGMVVNTESPVTAKAQEGVLEFLLINHPLDCPVCDKGGECPLQDQTFAYGPGESRYIEEKRHKEKPIAISDLVLLDRERCILCDRCTRFAKEVAGDPLIHFMHRGNNTEVNVFPDEPFASYFSGNTAQICPVGALTTTTYRFRARPWDLEVTESTCQTCGVGCRLAIDSSRDQVLRYEGVDIDPVNWGWLCDKGRFNFQAIQSEDRLRNPLLKGPNGFEVITWGQAMRRAADMLSEALSSTGPDGIGIVGGARLTNESAYAWAKLAKGVLGTDNVDARLGDELPHELVLGVPKATIDEVCRPGGTILYFGPDPKEELPVLYLRLRHAVIQDSATLIEVSPVRTGLTPLARHFLQHRPGEVHEAVRALIHGIPQGRDGGGVDPAQLGLARAAVEQAAASGSLTVVVGRQSIAESSDWVTDAVATLVRAFPEVKFLTLLRRGNVHGALDMGLAPGLLPGRVALDQARDWYGAAWPTVPAGPGLDTAGILQAAADGKINTLVLLGADPLTDFPDRQLAAQALQKVPQIIAVDLFLNQSVQAADLVLAAAGFSEVEGTATNLEGRVSVLNQKVTPPGTARSDWIIAAELARRLDSDLGLESADDIWGEIEQLAPSHHGVTLDALFAPEAADGIVISTGEPAPGRPPTVRFEPGSPLDPPAPDAYSLRLVANRKLYDLGTFTQASPALANLAPGTKLRVNPYDFERLGVPEGRVLKVKSVRGAISVEVVTDPDVLRGTAAIHVNQPGALVTDLIDARLRVTDIRIEVGEVA
ncbi:MAG: NADH-quinone oxidoreductase subunit NuoG [Acidimicrobiales bacterium]|nr:NADH-quinone oxidoreductase subunit NuoG [Acidimicrobiales bacterium]